MSDKSVKIGNPLRAYFSSFTTDQSPLAEGDVWRPKDNTALTNFIVSGGKAIGQATGDSFDDSAALLSGFSQDVEITATLFVGSGIASTTHEAELLLRSTQTTTTSRQVECLYSYTGGIQCFEWFVDGGGQNFAPLSVVTGSESALGRAFINGDRIRARVQGTVITMSVIEADNTVIQLATYTCPTLTGQPGIGAFTRQSEGGDLTKFNFQDVLVTDL